MPPAEISRAAQRLDASMVALSAVHPRLDAAGIKEVTELRRMLPPNIRLVVGGAAAEPHRDHWRDEGILCFRSLTEFRDSLVAWNGGH